MNKIALFGIGQSSQAVFDLIKKENNKVCALFDNDPQKEDKIKFGIRIQNINKAIDFDFDYIIITSGDWISIYQQLLDLKIPNEKICIYWLYHYQEHLNQQINLVSSSDVLIMGISYAYYMRFASLSYTNLAYGSQDVFFDSCLTRMCIDKNACKLKAAVLVLPQYVLEYDMLYSSNKGLCAKYLLITEIFKYANDVSEKRTVLLQQLEDPFRRYLNFQNRKAYLDIFSNKPFDFFSHINDEQIFINSAKYHSNKNYPQSVKENAKILEDLIVFLLENNIHPILVTPPQHKVYREHFSSRILNDFNSFIQLMRNKYPITYINDYYTDFDIKYFYDGDHLNYYGYELYNRELEEEIIEIIRDNCVRK